MVLCHPFMPWIDKEDGKVILQGSVDDITGGPKEGPSRGCLLDVLSHSGASHCEERKASEYRVIPTSKGSLAPQRRLSQRLPRGCGINQTVFGSGTSFPLRQPSPLTATQQQQHNHVFGPEQHRPEARLRPDQPRQRGRRTVL